MSYSKFELCWELGGDEYWVDVGGRVEEEERNESIGK